MPDGFPKYVDMPKKWGGLGGAQGTRDALDQDVVLKPRAKPIPKQLPEPEGLGLRRKVDSR